MKYATQHASVLVRGLMSPPANLRAPSASCSPQPLCNYVSLYIAFVQQLAGCFSYQMNYSAADSVLNPNNSSSNTSCSESLQTHYTRKRYLLSSSILCNRRWGLFNEVRNGAQHNSLTWAKSAELGEKSNLYCPTQLVFPSEPLFSTVPNLSDPQLL